MANVLDDYEGFDAFNEAYELVKTVDLVGYDRNIYRIEVLKCYSNRDIPFTVNYYIQGFLSVKPKLPSGEEMDLTSGKETWVPMTNMPSTRGDTAESTLKIALAELGQSARH